jgi:glutamine phosphoribosylpyrophosphate amidotransferase
MCGIVGYSGVEPVDEMDFKILLLYSQQRGTQSTGYGTKDFVAKATSNSPYFVSRNSIPETNLIIGHTRNPSYGTKKTENEAQPFSLENIVGGHNGKIYMRHTDASTYKDVDVDSDSYPLLNMISDKGLEDALDSVFYSSSLALIWIDRKKETLNLYRYDKPTYIGQKNGGIYVASVDEYLEAIGCTNIQKTKEKHHYVIKNGSIKSLRKLEITRSSFSSQKTEDKEKKTDITNKSYDNVPKILSSYAPDGAPCMFIDGIKRYYWIDKNNVVHVESVIAYNNSEHDKYDLNTEIGRQSLSKRYLKILNKVNEMLEE